MPLFFLEVPQKWEAAVVNYSIPLFQSYDYGIAQAPELESHGGTTFCAVATLALMNQLNTCFTNKQVKS
jgi:geranylgeranyl transferase type-1 subunit beta